MEQEIMHYQPQAATVATLDSYTLDIQHIIARKVMLRTVMEKIMQKDEHYGVIPGCGKKPSLLKPGAEAILSTFQLAPRYLINKVEMAGGHREYEITCELYAPNGAFVGSGVGSATTMEGKYRFRVGGGTATEIPVPKAYWDAKKTDPRKASTILRDLANKAGHEGDSFGTEKDSSGTWVITTKAKDEKVEHDNPADYYNTVLKMSKKRAMVDAVLTATGASDIFTQDVEDMVEVRPGAAQAAQEKQEQAPAHAPAANASKGDPRPPAFDAPVGMDDMPGQAPAKDTINLDGLERHLKGMADLAELAAEYKVVENDPRWADSDQKAINRLFNSRKAALTPLAQ